MATKVRLEVGSWVDIQEVGKNTSRNAVGRILHICPRCIEVLDPGTGETTHVDPARIMAIHFLSREEIGLAAGC